MMYYEMTGFMPKHPDGQERPDIRFPDHSNAWLLLDFDGSLVEIADRPDGVDVPDRVQALLDRAQERLDGRVALVSGRSVESLEHFLPGFRGSIVGTHGAELRIDGTRSRAVEWDEATVSRLQRVVADFAALRPEFLVEPKPSGVVLHYRQAEELGALALHFMEALSQAAEGFRLQPALMAYEIKPEGVGKDAGIKRLLGDDRHVPIYAGDDLTDEPALGLVRERGGVSIKIGQCETVAEHRLAGPSQLLDHLERWLG
ncbi:trehalose-phosphatase [Jannaschia sp. W003]|uniref:trehalose-phosphatase n=1 Tax=Jannaschia sp. W003 TaxID=2867012 RepID=UPI0021A86127|nr:trehalose-phosphatase [Jannaschia sp. W003]UWQ21315.1 trehalose-phosphatase [Jannaschia sp. W003]